ncbi:34838_t:CDS:2, partial [Racocetra persica]
KSIDNVRYEAVESDTSYMLALSDETVTTSHSEYADKYAVKVANAIVNPDICSMELRQAATGARVGGLGLLALGALAAPFSFGGSLALTGAVAAAMGTEAEGNIIERGARKVAENVCKWSSEVYEEKFARQQEQTIFPESIINLQSIGENNRNRDGSSEIVARSGEELFRTPEIRIAAQEMGNLAQRNGGEFECRIEERS